MTPLLAWGAGLRGAQQVAPGEEGGAGEDGWSEKWGLSRLRRCDVNHCGGNALPFAFFSDCIFCFCYSQASPSTTHSSLYYNNEP